MVMLIIFSIFHFFVNIFAGGRSIVKVILFSFFFILTVAIFFIKKEKVVTSYRKVNNFFYTSVVILYSWSLFLFVYFFHSFSLRYRDYVLLFSNKEISSSVWYHSHIMKGAIGIILQFLGAPTLENVDAGVAYVGLIPHYLFIIGFLILCITIIAAFLYIFYIRLKTKEKTSYEKIILAFIFSISMFSLIKTGVDGGIFHPDALISVSTILFINYILNRQDKIKSLFSRKKTLLYILALVFFAYVFIFVNFSYQIVTGYLYVLLMSTLFVLYLELAEAKYLIAIFLLFAFFASTFDRDIFNYGKLEVKNDTPVYIFSYKPPSGIFTATSEKKIGAGILYTVISQKDTTVDELAKNIGVATNMNPVAIPWQTCAPSTGGDVFFLNFHTKDNLPDSLFDNTSSWVHFKIKGVKINGSWNDTVVETTVAPCTPRVLNVLDETIKESLGNTPYFLSNLKNQ